MFLRAQAQDTSTNMAFRSNHWIVVTNDNAASDQQLSLLREDGIRMRVLNCAKEDNRNSSVCRDIADNAPAFCTDDGRCFAGQHNKSQLDALQSTADSGLTPRDPAGGGVQSL